MSARLPPVPGEWLDRSRVLTFRFEGEIFSGFAGDVIGSALLASGAHILGRSFKYHRPRGVLSMANHDANALVEDRAHVNLRADVTAVVEGMHLVAVNTFGGVQADRARVVDRLSRLLPVGFYYKAFHRPKALAPGWERFFRSMTGLGAVKHDAPRLVTPKGHDFCDVLVIGAGPSGLA
ncbi:MAG TPA: 2Fe-2S iron-sulfur cluster-binding protein, partial [Burkholderiales bacterium]|nr:2Fe-2S iron-sulfur cluster-binding protein [Burkholderiales bacterium]